MRKAAFALAVLATTFMVTLYVATTRAAEVTVVTVGFMETWVATTGDNRNNCSRTQPCRTFERAIDMTAPGGHVGVLDAGNFGSFFIGKALSITNDGPGEARVTIRRPDVAINVRAGPSDRVYLRGLTIDGLEGGVIGIYFGAGAALHIHNCTIRNFRQRTTTPGAVGIMIAATAESEVYISDSVITGNGNAPEISYGLAIQPGEDGTAKVMLNRVQINDNVNGVLVDGSAITRRPEIIVGRPAEQVRPMSLYLAMRDSVIAGNTGFGLTARSTSTATPLGLATTVVVDRTMLVSNGVGIAADSTRATVRVVDSTITGNGTGLLSLNAGHLNYAKSNTFGDNRVNIQDFPLSGP